MATHWTGLPEGDGDKLKACGAASACEVSQLAGRWLMSVKGLKSMGSSATESVSCLVAAPQLTRREVNPGLLLLLGTLAINYQGKVSALHARVLVTLLSGGILPCLAEKPENSNVQHPFFLQCFGHWSAWGWLYVTLVCYILSGEGSLYAFGAPGIRCFRL